MNENLQRGDETREFKYFMSKAWRSFEEEDLAKNSCISKICRRWFSGFGRNCEMKENWQTTFKINIRNEEPWFCTGKLQRRENFLFLQFSTCFFLKRPQRVQKIESLQHELVAKQSKKRSNTTGWCGSASKLKNQYKDYLTLIGWGSGS